MLVLEAKLYGKSEQFKIIDEMILTAQFIRNRCIRHWMDNKGVGQYDLSALTKDLAKEFVWCGKSILVLVKLPLKEPGLALSVFTITVAKKLQGKKAFHVSRRMYAQLNLR
jgi:putative transposase